MRRTENWTIVVARKANIHGPHQDIDQMLLTSGTRSRTSRTRDPR